MCECVGEAGRTLRPISDKKTCRLTSWQASRCTAESPPIMVCSYTKGTVFLCSVLHEACILISLLSVVKDQCSITLNL